MSNEGHISRERLFDACLDGLSRDLQDLRARFFALIHEGMEPKPEELAARRTQYLGFLGSGNPSTIAFALDVLEGLLKAGQVDHGALVDRLTPALHLPTRSSVRQALSLLDIAARQSNDRALKARAAVVAVEGLVHESADIQEEILQLLDRHGDPRDGRLRDQLISRRDAMAAALRKRVETWLGIQEEPEPEQEQEPETDDPAELGRRARRLIRGLPPWRAFPRRSRSFVVSEPTFPPCGLTAPRFHASTLRGGWSRSRTWTR